MEALCSYLPASVLSYLLEHSNNNINADTGLLVPPFRHSYTTCVLFADVSGFTALCEAMGVYGPEGDEHLAKHLNSYFELLVRTMSSQGGDVFKFAGDAILAVWPPSDDDITTLTRRAGQCALEIKDKLQDVRFDDNITLSVKIGVGVGEISILHIGGVFGRMEYCATGPALPHAFEAEHHASARDVVMSPQAYALVEKYFECDRTSDNYAKLKSCIDPIRKVSVFKTASERHIKTNLKPDLLKRVGQYVPSAVVPYINHHEEKWASELRRITVLFVNLGLKESDLTTISTVRRHLGKNGDSDALNTVQAVLQAVQYAVYQYEGSLNKFLMDDKGSTLIAVFGLPPLAHEDDSVRGVLSALAICAKLYKLGLVPAVGVTTGMAFCGVVGARGRREYSVLGDTVNLAARLMQHATKCGGGVVCDTITQQQAKHRLHFDDLGKINVKGKVKPIGIWQPYTRDALKQQSQLPILQVTASANGSTRSSSPDITTLEKDNTNNIQRHRHQRSDSVVLLTLPKHVLSPTSAATAPVSLSTNNVMHDIHTAAVANYSNKHFDHLRGRQSVSVSDSAVHGSNNSTTASPRYGLDRRSSLSLAPVNNIHTALQQTCHTVGPTPGDTRHGSLFIINNDQHMNPLNSDIHSTYPRTARIILPSGTGHVSLPIEHCKSLHDIKLELWKLTRVTHILSNETTLQQVHFTINQSDVLNDDVQLDSLYDAQHIKSNNQPLTLQLVGATGADQINLIDQLSAHKQLLLQQIHTLLTTRKPHCTIIEAEIGLGKSQLLYNTINETPLRVYAAAATPFDDTSLNVWKNILLQLIDTDVESNPELYTSTQLNNRIQCITFKINSATQHSSNTNTDIDTLVQLLPCLNDLFHATMFADNEYSAQLDPNERQHHCTTMIILLLQSFTRTHSIVIAIDDAIYLAQISWSLLHSISEQVDNLLLLIATRPINKSYMTAFQQSIPTQYSTLIQSSNTTHLLITPRTDDQIYSIACEILGAYVGELPPMLAQLILTKAHGNPLVVREMLYELQQRQLIYVTEDKYVSINANAQSIQSPTSLHTQRQLTSHNADEPFHDIHVPILLQCILGCRLDRLTHIQRMILKVGAMIGDEFNLDLTCKAYPLTIDNHTQWYNELLDLVKLNIIKPCVDARIVDTQLPIHSSKQAHSELVTRYTFSNGFMRDMVLSRLLGYQKKSLQEKVNDSRLEQFRKMNVTLTGKIIKPHNISNIKEHSMNDHTDIISDKNIVVSTLSGYLTVVENKGKINEKLKIRYLALVENMLCVWLTEDSFISQSYDGAWSVLYLDDARLVIDYTIELGFTLTCNVWKLSSEYSLVTKSITLVCQSQSEHTLWLQSLQHVIGGHANHAVISSTMKRIQHEHMLSQSRLNSTLRLQNRYDGNNTLNSLSSVHQISMLHTPVSNKQSAHNRQPQPRLISDSITAEQLKGLYQRFVQSIDHGDNNVAMESTLCDVQKQANQHNKKLLSSLAMNQWKKRYVTLTNDNLCFNVHNSPIDDKPAHTRPVQCLCLTVGHCTAHTYIDTTRRHNQHIVAVECEIWLKGGEFFYHKRQVNIGMRSAADANRWTQSIQNVIKSHYIIKSIDTPNKQSRLIQRQISHTDAPYNDTMTPPIPYQRYSIINSDQQPMSPMSPLTPTSPHAHTSHKYDITSNTKQSSIFTSPEQLIIPQQPKPPSRVNLNVAAPHVPQPQRISPRQQHTALSADSDHNLLQTPRRIEYTSVSTDMPASVTPLHSTSRRGTARSFTVPSQLESPAAGKQLNYAHHNRLSIAASMHNRRISLNASPNSKAVHVSQDTSNNISADNLNENPLDSMFDSVMNQVSDKSLFIKLQQNVKQYVQQMECEYMCELYQLQQQQHINVMSMVDQCDIDEQTKNWLAINYTRDQVGSPKQSYINNNNKQHNTTVNTIESTTNEPTNQVQQFDGTLSPHKINRPPTNPILSPRNIIQSNLGINVGDLTAWDWDIWQIEPNLFLPCIVHMFHHFHLFDTYKIEPIKFVNFIHALTNSYNTNSYHNVYHAIDTCQTSYVFLRSYGATEYIPSLDILSLLLAALCHDVGHSGLTNNYHCNAGTALALLYNDQSVLENYHCTTTFKLLSDPSCNVLCNLSHNDYKHVRHSMISGILATDMSQHFVLLERFNSVMCSDKFTKPTTTQLTDNERTVIFNVVLHSADISNPCKPWVTQKKWADALLVELLAQGDRELNEGLPVSPNCSRSTTNQSTLTLNFMDFIVAPIYVSLRQLLSHATECINHLKYNRQQWSTMLIQQLQLSNDSNELQRWSKRDESFHDILMKNELYQHNDANNSSNILSTPRHTTQATQSLTAEQKSIRSSKRSTIGSASNRRSSILRLESFVRANSKPATLNTNTAKALFSTLQLKDIPAQAKIATIDESNQAVEHTAVA